MKKSDAFRNLRSGPIASANFMNDATMRTWVANYNLKLGDRETRTAGNPRYDLADCARVFMLEQLTKRLRLAAEPAVWAVNKAALYLDIIAERELAGMDDQTAAPDCPRYILRLPASAGVAETNPTIRLFDDELETIERNGTRGKWCEIVMDLREIVRAARDRLSGVLNISLVNFRHDFADAPEHCK